MTKILVDKAVIEQALDALEVLGCVDSYAAIDLREALAEQDHIRDATKKVQEPVAWLDDYEACKCWPDETRCYTDRVFRLIQKYVVPSEPVKQEPVGVEWRPCMKLPIVVHVREQRNGESHVSTREGIAPITSEDLIMRGVAGEEYPIGRELFNKTYRLLEEPK